MTDPDDARDTELADNLIDVYLSDLGPKEPVIEAIRDARQWEEYLTDCDPNRQNERKPSH